MPNRQVPGFIGSVCVRCLCGRQDSGIGRGHFFCALRGLHLGAVPVARWPDGVHALRSWLVLDAWIVELCCLRPDDIPRSCWTRELQQLPAVRWRCAAQGLWWGCEGILRHLQSGHVCHRCWCVRGLPSRSIYCGGECRQLRRVPCREAQGHGQSFLLRRVRAWSVWLRRREPRRRLVLPGVRTWPDPESERQQLVRRVHRRSVPVNVGEDGVPGRTALPQGGIPDSHRNNEL